MYETDAVKKALKLIEQGSTARQAALTMNIAISTIYRARRRHGFAPRGKKAVPLEPSAAPQE